MAQAPSNVKPRDEERFGTSTPYGGKPTSSTGSLTEKAKDAASTLTEKAKDAASAATEKAKDAAASAAQTAGDAASNIGEKAESATASVGSGMKSLASSIREHTPRSGVMGTASSAVANTLESGGRYLEEEGLRGIGEDLTNLIRRNPIPALLVGIGVGYLLARATRS